MSLRTAARVMAPIAVLASASLVLTACGSSDSKDAKSTASPSASSSPSASADGCSTSKSGKTSDSVKVTGAFGATPTVTFTKPLKATDLERTVVSEGKGKTTVKGESVSTKVTVYLGTGKSLGTQPLNLTVGNSAIPEAFTAGASCLPLGSRTVVTTAAKDVYGDQGNPQAGIAATDSMVIVTDLVSDKKQLTPAKWTKDVPSVKFDAKGKPTLTLSGKPAKQLELKVLKQGTGAVVKSGDQVTLDYQGTNANNGKIFDQSYGKTPATFGTDQVVEGFGAALIGQKVGTKLVVSIPPKYAYGAKPSKASPLAGKTLVFVIDIHEAKSS